MLERFMNATLLIIMNRKAQKANLLKNIFVMHFPYTNNWFVTLM